MAQHRPGPTSLSPAEVSAYLEREFKLLKRAARGISPYCQHTADDLFTVMVLEYINRARSVKTFRPEKTYGGILWNYIRNAVVAAAMRYLRLEKRRGMTIGKGRMPNDFTGIKYESPEQLERVVARDCR